MMEVKVWVDGIQRVVCGATLDTTCQDVVIALAHAMGRTGRFTLIEKWRDNDRPLTPAECPLRVLHKWGEFAGEVRFVLCQADAQQQQQKKASVERLGRKGLEPQGLSPIHTARPQPLVGEASVKRSLTFSGANHQMADDLAGMASSAPTSKFRKTHQGPVPNEEVKPSTTALPRSVSVVGRPQRGEAVHTAHPLAKLCPSVHHPITPHPRPPPGAKLEGFGDAPASSLKPSLLLSHSQFDTSAKRVSAFQPPQSSRSRLTNPSEASPVAPTHSMSQSQSHSKADGQSQSQSHPVGFRPPEAAVDHDQTAQDPATPHHSEQFSNDENPYVNTASLHALALPSSPSPLPSSSLGQSESAFSDQTPSISNVEIEEYDLDHGIAEPHRNPSHSKDGVVNLEYRLEDCLGSGSGSVSGLVMGSRSGVQLEGEHAKLLRLVNLQQQRLKTQDSQLSMLNSEISELEEKESEYEENLHVIMEELLLQENRQRELEPQLGDLEKVEWETVLEEEMKCEEDLSQKITSCKAMILDHDRQLDDAHSQETQLLQEMKEEGESIAQERQRLKEVEAQAKEEERRTKEEIVHLQTEFSQLQKHSQECQLSLTQVDSQLTSMDHSLEEKGQQLKELEADLKAENLKGLADLPRPDRRQPDGGEALMKILESRLSPHPMDTSSAPVLPALTPANQSGVWV